MQQHRHLATPPLPMLVYVVCVWPPELTQPVLCSVMALLITKYSDLIITELAYSEAYSPISFVYIPHPHHGPPQSPLLLPQNSQPAAKQYSSGQQKNGSYTGLMSLARDNRKMGIHLISGNMHEEAISSQLRNNSEVSQTP